MSAAPNPSRLLLLAALGIGTYWMLTRQRAVAAAPTPSGQVVRNPYVGATPANLAAQAVGVIGRLLNGGITPGTVDGRSAAQWDTTPSYGQPGVAYNNPSAFTLATSAIDGLPYNPVSASPYDSTAYGFDGSNGAWWN